MHVHRLPFGSWEWLKNFGLKFCRTLLPRDELLLLQRNDQHDSIHSVTLCPGWPHHLLAFCELLIAANKLSFKATHRPESFVGND